MRPLLLGETRGAGRLRWDEDALGRLSGGGAKPRTCADDRLTHRFRRSAAAMPSRADRALKREDLQHVVANQRTEASKRVYAQIGEVAAPIGRRPHGTSNRFMRIAKRKTLAY